ncbi:MAG: hypothetical protein HYZ54_03590, partial [Ignavibacteriae bacterium]|nr:hypothetical protein [Ignavibacteriota bacterium]
MRYIIPILRFAFTFVFAICACIFICFGQIPRTFSYQGTLTDQVQTPFPDSSYKLTFAIYSDATGGSAVWQETHDVTTQGGVFDVTLGSASPLIIAFDKQLWLGVTLQGNTEMIPRTALVSAPYSLYSDLAATATALAPNATGAVLSLNGLSGSLTLQGGGKTNVSKNGSTVLISSIGGIDRIDAADGSVSIINPNGPISTISVADGGITTPKIADAAITTSKLTDNSVSTIKVLDGAIISSKLADASVSTAKVIDGSITASKVSPLGANSGQALTFNGTNVEWGSPSPSGAAGGDLTGNYPNPSIASGSITTSKLADGSITTSKLADGSVSTPKISDGAITASKVNSSGAVLGQALIFNGTNVVWGAPSPSGSAGGDLTGTYPNPSVASNAITTNKLADGSVSTAKLTDGAVTMDKIADAQVTAAKLNSFGASSGQTLLYNGTNIVWGNSTPGGNAGGDLTGTYPNPVLTTTAVVPGSYGSATQVPVFNVDSKGRVTGVTNTTISASPAGVAGGDLTGTYPNPTLTTTTVTPGSYGSATQVPVFNVDSKGRVTGVTNTAIAASPSGAAGGDLTGTYPNPTIITNAVTTSKILDANVTTSKLADGSVTNAKVNSSGATSGQALTFNGTNVIWGSPSPSGAAGGDLTGTYPNPTITT